MTDSLYRSYKYHLKRNNHTVAAFSTARGLPLTTHPSVTRPLAAYEAITLERGVSYNPDFEQWAKAVADYENLPREGVSLTQLRQELTLEVRGDDGQPVNRFTISRCWVSELQTIDNANAPRRQLAISSLTLENEGIQPVLPDQ